MDKIQTTIEYLMNDEEEELYTGKGEIKGFDAAARRLFPRAFRIDLDLSKDEKHEVNKELCSRIKAGDKRAEKALVYFNFPMLHQVVSQKCRSYELTDEDYEDVLQECAFRLVEVAHSFDAEQAPFFYYAYECIKNLASRLCKKLKTGTVSLDEPCEDEEGNVVTLMDVTPDEKSSAELERYIMLHSIYAEVEKLPLPEKVVFSMHNGLGEFNEMSLTEIADYIGLNYQTVYRHYHSALETIRKNLGIRPAA